MYDLPENLSRPKPDDDIEGRKAKDLPFDEPVDPPDDAQPERHRKQVDEERTQGHPAHAVRDEYRAKGEKVGPRHKGDLDDE